MTTVDRIEIACSCCGSTASVKPTKRGVGRPPAGWKRLGEELLCRACKKAKWRLRAVTFPVATVDGDWDEFTAALKISWARSTELANWAVRKLLAADSDRKATDAKLPPFPPVDLYRLWTDTYHDRAAWSGAAQSANAILHAVDAKYRRRRFEVIWRNEAQPPRYTYPLPYPVHNAAWKAEYVETDGGKVPSVTVTLDGRKWVIRLRGGYERSRQLKAFAQIASGEALRGELAIYRQRSYGSHRRTMSQRAPGGGSTFKTRIMVKLVAHLPVPKKREAKGTMELRTGRRALLVAMCPGREKPWLYHAYQLRRAIYCYDQKRQRIADDLKAERRPASASLREHQERAAGKMNRRIDTEIRQIAAMAVAFAVRQGLAEIVYNDDERRYFSRFDWGKLLLYLTEACENHSVIFRDASGDVVENADTSEPPGTD